MGHAGRFIGEIAEPLRIVCTAREAGADVRLPACREFEVDARAEGRASAAAVVGIPEVHPHGWGDAVAAVCIHAKPWEVSARLPERGSAARAAIAEAFRE